MSGTPENPPSPLTDDARKALAMVHEGWDHLRRQRPLAAWASWQRALRIDPEHAAARQALDYLANAEDLPAAARVPYRFRPPRGDESRARWDAALRSRAMEDLRVAAEVFGSLADADPSDAPARSNQALCLAWLGENVLAIEALDAVVRTEAAHDFEAAVEAWTLAEILRQGGGAEPLADDVSHSLILEWPSTEGEPIAWLSSFAMLRPLPTPLDPISGQPAFADARAFEWLDREMPAPDPALTVDDLPHVRASVIAAPGSLRFSSPDLKQIEGVDHDIRTALNDRKLPFDRRTTPLPLALMDAAVWQFRLPEGLDEPTRHRLTREAVERYYEDTWINVPRRGLGELDEYLMSEGFPWYASRIGHKLGNSQVERIAAQVGHSGCYDGDKEVAQAKLGAIVRLREQLAARPRVSTLYAGYPFDRLRRRLGLEPIDPAVLDPDDVSCMGMDELNELDPEKLDDSTVFEAYRSARALGTVPETLGRLALDTEIDGGRERDHLASLRAEIADEADTRKDA